MTGGARNGVPRSREGSGRRSVTGELAALAWRNVWRNRRRTTLNVVALSVGMGIFVLALGWIGGYHTYIYETLRDFQTGEVQVMHADWYDERTRLPVDLLVEDYETVRAAVSRVPGVREEAVTGRVLFSLRVSTGRRSWRTMATAIDLRYESAVGVLGEYVREGRRPGERAGGERGERESDDTAESGQERADSRPPATAAQRGIWIGRPVAEKAGLSLGDTLFLRAVNRHGVENLFDVPVAGIFEYGYPALDEQMVYVDLNTADELLDLDGAVTHVVARLDQGTGVSAGVERIAAELGGAAVEVGVRRSDAPDAELEVRPWQDFARAAVTAVEQDTNSFALMMAIMYLLIVLGIVNSMSMSVHERTREIGTMRAIGMRGRSLLAMFAMESVWQAVIAAVVALIVTTPVAIWLAGTGVDLVSSMPDDIPIPFGDRFRADFAVWHYLFTVASGLVTALLGAIIPARRAARITVAEAMRTVG
ncbi:MAG: FtsX-like permease family protein [Alkalispirochaeta sp.]